MIVPAKYYGPVPVTLTRPIPQFYECGICSAMHSLSWDGDCRQDGARFYCDEIDERFGFAGWQEVDMPGGEGY